MKKWTYSDRVSLSRILEVRYPLKEIECWAVLTKTAHALQDHVLTINARGFSSSSSSSKSSNDFVICPQRVICTPTGHVYIDTSVAIDKSFNVTEEHGSYENRCEFAGIYSLGKTVLACCQRGMSSKTLTRLLDDMTCGGKNQVDLLHVLETTSNHMMRAGLLSVSQLVADLTTQARLETKPSSTLINNNNGSSSSKQQLLTNRSEPPLLRPRTSTGISDKNCVKRTTNNKAVKRNPSRLYRMVQPLAKVIPTPSPATNKCVGPEFVVMGERSPVMLDLVTDCHSRRDVVRKQVDVEMLNGQRYSVRCNAASVTAGKILEQVLNEQDTKERNTFTLAMLKNGEYLPLCQDIKISKIGPPGWKDTKHSVMTEGITLYQRFKFFPSDVDDLKDTDNKHRFYLQMRRDVIDGYYHMSKSQLLSLAGMSLQVEFGDYSEDIHGKAGDYFIVEHYLPSQLLQNLDRDDCVSSLVRLHRAHLGQSQSKTEMKYCRELQRLDNFGFHLFSVSENKRTTPDLASSKTLGIHTQGIFLFNTSKDLTVAHKIMASFFWHKISRIQHEKGLFQLLVQDRQKAHKLKYHVWDHKAKLLFALASAHHQHNQQLRLKQPVISSGSFPHECLTNDNKGPPRSIRTLKSRLLFKKSPRKVYTNTPNGARGSLRRSTTVSSDTKNNPRHVIKRLAHYSSMADALLEAKSHTKDKENTTPPQSYKYGVYLESEEDIRPVKEVLQERPVLAELTTPTVSRRSVSTNPGARRRSESHMRVRSSTSAFASRTGRRSHGVIVPPGSVDGSSVMRMGTRVSLSALHRERLRLTSDFGGPVHEPLKKPSLDIDYDTMEVKPLPEKKPPAVVLHTSLAEAEAIPYCDGETDQLSDSLLQRFEDMETDEAEPERQIVAVTVRKDIHGKLGLRITGTPSGIYVDDFDLNVVKMEGAVMKQGDRIVAINGRSLENVSYTNALELIRQSHETVSFLVSQIKH